METERQAARAAALCCTALFTLHAGQQLTRVFPLDGAGVFGGALVLAFTACFGWVALGAMLFAFGLLVSTAGAAARGPRPQPGARLDPAARTAVLLPIRHEDPDQVVAQVEVMLSGLGRLPAGWLFDFVLLSDSSEPEATLAEEQAWRALRGRLGAQGRVHYRRREGGKGKKSGNLRDFLLRHGAAYRYLIVLDADSMVRPETLCALVERMEAHPEVGLIQLPVIPVRRRSLFARWQQFAARVYGPLWTRAEAALAGPDGNYFGHNAILRREAFCGHAGLGLLPGRGPLSGLVASHDFVEAALIRRAGYQVWTAHDLSGSYEQCPTTLVDYAVRDQRWCQGNLQHLRIALLPGLRAWSRLHLLRGTASYLVPPLTLLFTWLALLVAAHDQLTIPQYFPAERLLFPRWPVHDFAAGRGLLALTAVFLFGPKVLAAVAAAWSMLRAGELSPRRLPSFVASLLLESLLGALLAPTLMVYQAAFVVRTLYGKGVSWAMAHRADRQLGLLEALRHTWLQLLVAALLGGISAWVSLTALLWSLPVVAPLLLSPLLAWFASSRAAQWLAEALDLLQVPEDRSGEPCLAVYDGGAAAAARADRQRRQPAPEQAQALRLLTLLGSGIAGRP